MEDDLNFVLKKEDDLNFFENGRWPQKQLKIKAIIYLKIEGDLNFLKKEDDLKKNNATKNN